MAGNEIINGTSYYFTKASDDGKQEKNSHVVVLVHGIGCYSYQWELLKTDLEGNGFRVLSYDLIGRGYSNYPEDNQFDEDAHVDQLRMLITELGINKGQQKYSLIGHSMGGAIAALYGSRFKEEIASIIFLSPAGLMDLPGALKMVRGCCSCFQGIVSNALKSGQEKAWRQGFKYHQGKALEIENDLVDKLRIVMSQRPTAHDGFWQSALQFPLSGLDAQVRQIAESDVSVCVIWGRDDTAVPVVPSLDRWKAILSAGTPDSNTSNSKRKVEFTVMDDVEHAFFLEKPEESNALILNFLKSI